MNSIVFSLVMCSLVACIAANSLPDHNTLKTNGKPRSPVGSCPEIDPAYPVYLPDSEKCEVFYECRAGEAVPTNCPPDLWFNPILDVCDFPDHSGCQVNNSQISLKRKVRSVEGTCPEVDPATPVYLPDTENCKLFYECRAGIPVPLECPPNLWFNPTLDVCDFPEHSGCQANGNGAKFMKSPRSVVGTCPEKDPATAVLLPDSEKCEIYYECNNGTPIKNVCPPDLWFNPTLRVCDYPADSGCQANDNTEVPPTSERS